MATRVQSQYVQFGGGEDLVSAPVSIAPGRALFALNFDPGVNEGYDRIKGYERFDGQPSPHEATGTATDDSLPFDRGYPQISVGDTITSATGSGYVESITLTSGDWSLETQAVGTFYLSSVTGTFTSGQTLSNGASGAATTTGPLVPGVPGDDEAAQEAARALISAVPGSGPVRGVWAYNNDVYAFRDNTLATACLGYKATSSGWSAVAALTLSAGGSYEFSNYNFLGSATGENMYFVNGVDKAQQWDGTTLTPITTGMTTDTPNHLATHLKYLFLSFEGSLQLSDVGDPTSWVTGWGAAEIGVGDYITGLKSLKGGLLAVFAKDSINFLGGDGSSYKPWYMSPHGSNVGAREKTIQVLSDTFFLDRMGITSLLATNAFGDFSDAEVSQDVRPYVASLIGKEVGSNVIRSTSMMRMYFDNGTGTEFVTVGLAGGNVRGITRGWYPFNLECAESVDVNGRERIFAGSDDGYVYELEVGTNFDSAKILAILRLAFNHMKSPSMLKSWRALWLDVKAVESQTITFTVEQDYGDEDKPEAGYAESVLGVGGYWGSVAWDEFAWSGQPIFPARAPLSGIGYNMAIIISTETDYDEEYSLMGAMIHFNPRRMLR